MDQALFISVVMPVYNGARYLHEAIESILWQTFDQFEFLIINDGSTDEAPRILAHYAQRDSRIRIIEQAHLGLIAALNNGCCQAKGKYIARMDADDVSLPERFRKQVEYMEANPEIGILGTWAECIDGQGAHREDWYSPTSPALVRWHLLFSDCVVHPSSMMRRDLVRALGFYRDNAVCAEDYDLMARAIEITNITNLPDLLLRYRVWNNRVTSRYPQMQHQSSVKVVHGMAQALLARTIPEEAIDTIRKMGLGLPLTSRQIESAAGLIRKLCRAYTRRVVMKHKEAKKVAQ
ncbi:MAG: glycosyltransferase, partial [Candidatus Omnitrophica bacterium]|nr:glycosyltransferase [Candidatus Omnitrophota bacterium]